MNNTSKGPPLVTKIITGGGARIPPAEGITLVTASPMNDAADRVADNGNTVSELNGLQNFMAAKDGAIQPSNRRGKMTGGIVAVDADGFLATVPALPTFENEKNDAGVNINEIVGNVSPVDSGVEDKVQCLDKEEITGGKTPLANTCQKSDGATWKIALGKCSVSPRQLLLRPRVLTKNKFAPLQGLSVEITSRKTPVLLAGVMQRDQPLPGSNRAVQSVFVSQQATLSAAALQRELVSGAELESSSLSTTECLLSEALLPGSVANEKLVSVAKSATNSKAQIPILSSDVEDAG